MQSNLTQLLRTIVSSIAKKTPDPEISYDSESAEFLVRVNDAGGDHGRMVGKKGSVIGAIQTIFWYAGLRAIKRSVGVRLLNPVQNGDSRPTPFVSNPNWDKERIKTLIEAVLEGSVGSEKFAWIIDEDDEHIRVVIRLKKHLQDLCSDPDLASAIKKLIKAAGMTCGCVLEPEVSWE